MAPPPVKRSFTMSVDADLARMLAEYMEHQGHNSTSQALREIAWAYLAATPKDGVLRAAREHTVSMTKRWIFQQVKTFAADLSTQIKVVGDDF